MRFITDEIEYRKEMKAGKVPDEIISRRKDYPAGFLPFRPNILSPGDAGMIIEDVWPSLYFGIECIDEIKRKTNSLIWARRTFDLMIKEADIILKEAPKLPLARSGWRHDYFSRRTGQHLLYDPKTYDIFVDPATGRREYDVTQHKAWVLLTHERTYRLMRSMGVLYRLTGDERYAKWVALGISKAIEYFAHKEFVHRSEMGPSIYYSHDCDASAILMLAAAYELTGSSKIYDEEFRGLIREKLFRERISHLNTFLNKKGTHNMSCYAAAALVVSGEILEEEQLIKRGLTGENGFVSQLENGLLEDEDGNIDGLWFEGSMFYHFYTLHALITLYEKLKEIDGINSDISKRFRSMFSAPLKLIDDKLRLPALGGFGFPRAMNLTAFRHIYEYAAGCLDTKEYGAVLSTIYNVAGLPRHDLAALAYGPDEVREEEINIIDNIVDKHTYLPAAKTGVFRRKTPKCFYVLFRGGDYRGGHEDVERELTGREQTEREHTGHDHKNQGHDGQARERRSHAHQGHDHPDRLSIYIHSDGEVIAADLGEPGYCLREDFHNYYHSTIAHNTMFSDEKDQVGKAIIQWKDSEEIARACGVIKEGGVVYERSVLFDPPFIVLHDSYESEKEHSYGWAFHAYGPLQIDNLRLREKFRRRPVLDMRKVPEEGGYIMLAELVAGEVKGMARGRWKVKDKMFLEIMTLSNGPYELSKARSPGNPVLDYCSTLMLRATGPKRLFYTVFELHDGKSSLEDMQVDKDGNINIKVKNKGERSYSF